MELSRRLTAPPVSFDWDERRELAAALIAQGDLTMDKIASAVGIDRNTLWWWRTAPAFAERIDQHLSEIREAVMREGIAVKVNRLRAMSDRHRRMCQIVQERAEWFEKHPEIDVRSIPGGQTGLLARQEKIIGSGTHARYIEEYITDTGLLKEIRALEEQAAREMGEYNETAKVEVGMKLYIGIDLDRV